MNVTKVTVSYECTINLENYENLKPSVTVEAALVEGEDMMFATQQLYEQAQEALGMALYDMTKTALENANLTALPEGKRKNTAASRVATFRWMQSLVPDEADDLLDEVLTVETMLDGDPVSTAAEHYTANAISKTAPTDEDRKLQRRAAIDDDIVSSFGDD